MILIEKLLQNYNVIFVNHISNKIANLKKSTG